MADDLMLFFFLFEMTTLASFLLIGFRGDETARANAFRALWMNQMGGVLILLGILASLDSGGGAAFSGLAASGWLLPVALLAVAAFVKGAFVPFDRWLLGAMVAPTPVSAILHSATMVKIAPFVILKLSPLLTATLLGEVVALVGALVFVAASYLALSREIIKEVLGFSTIAMLGLMVSLAALGTPEAVEIAMVLMVVHAVGKALLFLSAGVAEKRFHVKEVPAMAGLVQRSPLAGGMFLFGFAAMTLPPFGGMLVKLMSMELLASMASASPELLINFLALAVGSVLLTLLYFKMASAILSWDSDTVLPREAIGAGYAWGIITLGALSLLLMAGIVLYLGNVWALVVPLGILMLMPLGLRWAARFDRAREYHCGEQSGFVSAPAFFGLSSVLRLRMDIAFILLFIVVAGIGAVS